MNADYDPIAAWWAGGNPGSRPGGEPMYQLAHGIVCPARRYYQRFDSGSAIEERDGRCIRIHGDDIATLRQSGLEVDDYEVVRISDWTCFRLPVSGSGLGSYAQPDPVTGDMLFPLSLWTIVARDGAVLQGGRILEDLLGPAPRHVDIQGATRPATDDPARLLRYARREPNGKLRVALLHTKDWADHAIEMTRIEVAKYLGELAPHTEIEVYTAREVWQAVCREVGVANPDQAPGWVWREYEARVPHSFGLVVSVPDAPPHDSTYNVPRATGAILQRSLAVAHPLVLVAGRFRAIQSVVRDQGWTVTFKE